MNKTLPLERFAKAIRPLPKRHRRALNWFMLNAGTEQAWPRNLPDGTLLASKAKAIYKPHWTEYALSVRQNLSGRYPDRDPVQRSDGTWSYLYFQEGEDPKSRDSVYTNRGLLRCLQDGVPVGVMKQTKKKPGPRYLVLGVAQVAGWEEGYFFLEGFSRTGVSQGRGPRAQVEAIEETQKRLAEINRVFEPEKVSDARDKIVASIVLRRGQPSFRRDLIEIYGGKCVITGCSVLEVLEAAHITPYKGSETNHRSNGLLLRADVHTLFDLGLIAVDSATMKVVVAPDLMKSSYSELAGKHLRLPPDRNSWPNKAALDSHRRWSGL